MLKTLIMLHFRIQITSYSLSQSHNRSGVKIFEFLNRNLMLMIGIENITHKLVILRHFIFFVSSPSSFLLHFFSHLLKSFYSLLHVLIVIMHFCPSSENYFGFRGIIVFVVIYYIIYYFPWQFVLVEVVFEWSIIYFCIEIC